VTSGPLQPDRKTAVGPRVAQEADLNVFIKLLFLFLIYYQLKNLLKYVLVVSTGSTIE